MRRALRSLAPLLAVACAPATDLPMGALLADAPATDTQAVHQVCPDGTTTYGIDVSYYQGNINWTAVANAGVKFAFIRVSDGTGFLDPKYDQNWAGARAAGILRGTYQFFRSDDDPIAQADLLISHMGALQDDDLPPVADVESTDGVSNATRAQRLRTWLDRVESATGRRPIIYTGGYFWQDNVGQDFSEYPLWHAGYTGGTCPSTLANQWPDWTFWQFGSTGSVAGISGNVDENRFNGTVEQLRAFAGPVNKAPRGYLDSVTCGVGAAGWAQDEDAPDAAISVHVYIDGEAGSGARGFATVADRHRDDLCGAIGSCAHGFALPIPLRFRDNAPHTAFAYGIDSAGGNNPLLAQSGQSFTCAPPAPPLDVAAGRLRHVTSPDAMTAWSFSFDDVAPYANSVVDAYPRGAAWRDAPRLVRADGDNAVFGVDSDDEGGELRRHVTNPASLAAWKLEVSTIEVLSPAVVSAIPEGPALPAEPFLLRGEGPAVYVLDVLLEAAAEGEGEEPAEGEGEPAEGEGEPGDDVELVTILPGETACGAAGAPAAPLLLLALLRQRRRR